MIEIGKKYRLKKLKDGLKKIAKSLRFYVLVNPILSAALHQMVKDMYLIKIF